MDNKKAEAERKELNKKLLKRTFQSEMSSNKKMTLKCVIYFVAFCVGFLVSDWVIKWFSIDVVLLRMLITVAFVTLMQFLGEQLVGRIKKEEK